jgi:gluconokinase
VVVGLDLGTSGVKALAVDADLRIWAGAARRYGLQSPQAGWAEQEPDEVVDAALDVLSAVIAATRQHGAEIAAVGLSAAMHSVLAVDANGQPLTRALPYVDGRAAAVAARLRDTHADLPQRTGVPLHAMAPLCKIAWFTEHRPAVAHRAARWISLKEYLLGRLGAEVVVDHSIASGTGLFDLRRTAWDDEALAAAGIEAAQLSVPVPTTTAVDVPGLGVPVIVGGGDGALANLGAGATAPGAAAVSIGSSGAIRVITPQPETGDPHLFCATLDDRHWVVGGAISNGGLVLRWLRDRLFTTTATPPSYDALTALASATPPGADGLLFVPSLTPERAPMWDGAVGGALEGLELRHGAGHVVRAAMEGVALRLRWVAETMVAAGCAVGAVHATGGFTASTVWVQILADVLGREVVVPADPEGSSLGAALLGMVGAGMLGDVDDAGARVPTGDTVAPQASTGAVYEELSTRFRSAMLR